MRRAARLSRPGRAVPRGRASSAPAKVEARPDVTMPDLAAWLEAEHGVTADPSNLSATLPSFDVQGFDQPIRE